MNKELKSLISYLKKANNPSHGKILKLSQDYTEPTLDLDDESIEIDVAELRSLVDKDMKFKSDKIGLVVV